MTILHIIQALTPTAGTTVFVTELARLQQAMGHKVKIAVCNTHGCYCPADIEVVRIKNFHHFKFRPDIVHVHAVWSVFQANALKWCRSNQCKYVVSIHGCLMPRVFAKNPLKKWLFYWLFLKKNIRKASTIHCTSEYEKEVCKLLGFKGPFVVAPLGVDMPVNSTKPHINNMRTVLFVGRLGEEKGLVNLLDAWKDIRNQGWRLVLAGPDWLGYKKILDAKIEKESINGVEFTGAVDGDGKDALYRSADVFVLPSPMENFSMVVLEALAYGVPVIATRGTPWKELESHKCGWWIEQGVEALKGALGAAIKLSNEERQEMGAGGMQLVAEKYKWGAIAKLVVSSYKRILAHD